MDWFSFWLNGLTILSQGIVQLFFVSRFTKKKIRFWCFPLYLVLLYIIETAALVLQFNWLSFGLELAALYGINRMILKNNGPVSCVAAALAVYVTQLSFGIINTLELLIFPHLLGHALLASLFAVSATLAAAVLYLFCCNLIVKWFAFMDSQYESYIWLLFPSCLFFYITELYIIYTAYGQVLTVPYPIEIGKHMALLMLQLLGLGALFSTLYAYKRACENFHAQAALASLVQETRAQKAYVDQAQARYEQTRAFRHDIKNHLSVLDGLLKNGTPEQAQDYLRKLDIVTGELSFPVHTGNPVIDILLGDKLELARAEGVETEISLTLPQPCAAVDELDLCIIFANALDNAVWACRRVQGPKYIHIFGVRQGDFLMLEFENTCAAGPPPAMGTGLSNIKSVAEKYGGTIAIKKFMSCFQLNVLLNISLQPEDSSRPNT